MSYNTIKMNNQTIIYRLPQLRDNVVYLHIVIIKSSCKVWYVGLWCWLYFQWVFKGVNISFCESELYLFMFLLNVISILFEWKTHAMFALSFLFTMYLMATLSIRDLSFFFISPLKFKGGWVTDFLGFVDLPRNLFISFW